jgi:dTDP-4-amino-4,6-dideoxygalactose transaminase
MEEFDHMRGTEPVPFLDLARQARELEEPLREAFTRVLVRGNYILGEEVEAFEREFAAFCGAARAVGVASGTDALTLALKALGVGPGKEVILPAFSAPPTAVAVALTGARLVFADVDPATGNIDPGEVEGKICERTTALVVVHLYGRMADMPALLEIAGRHGVPVVEDCAQAHGASLQGRGAGTWGVAGCFSFYPTKNLGALGDAGMVITDDTDLAERIKSLRDYGREERDTLRLVGHNSRLDELQAAFLRVKLRYLPEWNRRRREIASFYRERLEGLPLGLPEFDTHDHSLHLFVVDTSRRDELREHLRRLGIQTVVHYPVPLHLQPPFLDGSQTCPAAEGKALRVLSLPLYPQMREEEVKKTAEAVANFFH